MRQFYSLSKKFLFLKYLHVHLIEDTGDYLNPFYLKIRFVIYENGHISSFKCFSSFPLQSLLQFLYNFSISTRRIITTTHLHSYFNKRWRISEMP